MGVKAEKSHQLRGAGAGRGVPGREGWTRESVFVQDRGQLFLAEEQVVMLEVRRLEEQL